MGVFYEINFTLSSIIFPLVIAVAKSRIGGNEERKSSGNMGGEKSVWSGLGSINKASLTDQCKNKIVKVCHDPGPIAGVKANGVFTERNIPPIGESAPLNFANNTIIIKVVRLYLFPLAFRISVSVYNRP
jgi:hypothetical protein